MSYFQYCGSILDSDVPPSVIRFLLLEEQEGEDDEVTLQKVLKEQSELARTNFAIIRREAQAVIDLVSHSSVNVKERELCNFLCVAPICQIFLAKPCHG